MVNAMSQYLLGVHAPAVLGVKFSCFSRIRYGTTHVNIVETLSEHHGKHLPFGSRCMHSSWQHLSHSKSANRSAISNSCPGAKLTTFLVITSFSASHNVTFACASTTLHAQNLIRSVWPDQQRRLQGWTCSKLTVCSEQAICNNTFWGTMAPHAVLGSSPTVRSSTPQPQRSGAKGANSVVPFTRRTGFAEKGDGSRQEGSRISGEGSSLPARQRYSLDDRYSRSPGGSALSSRSLPALRRPELIPQTVQRGFNAPPASQRPPTSPQQPRRTSTGSAAPVDGAPAGSSATGLLTRQFSSDLVRRPDQSELQVQFSKHTQLLCGAGKAGGGVLRTSVRPLTLRATRVHFEPGGRSCCGPAASVPSPTHATALNVLVDATSGRCAACEARVVTLLRNPRDTSVCRGAASSSSCQLVFAHPQRHRLSGVCLQRKLEKCMEKPAAVPRPPSSEPLPGLSSSEAAAAQLARLKVGVLACMKQPQRSGLASVHRHQHVGVVI